MAKLVKLDKLALVDEGGLIKRADKQLGRAWRELAAFLKDNPGREGKASIVITVELEADADDPTIRIFDQVQIKLPKLPIRRTSASLEYDKGHASVMVRASGSDEDEPRQEKLFPPGAEHTDKTAGEVTAAGANRPPKEIG